MNNLSFFISRSRCDACKHLLEIKDLIPILGFIINKGKCRYCGCKLDKKYLIIELLFGIVFIATYIKFKNDSIMFFILSSVMFLISYEDNKLMIIEDKYLIVILFIRIIMCILYKYSIINSIINGLVISILLSLIRVVTSYLFKKEMMGFGDILLIFVLGMFNNLYYNCLSLMISCLIGLLLCFVRKNKMIPFVPCLCIAYYITILIK